MGDFLLVGSKVIYLILLIVCGFFIRKLKLITDNGVKDLSKLLVDFFWPVLIFYQITSSLTAEDIIVNYTLPLFAIITGVVGYILGIGFVKIFKYQDNEKKIFLYNSTINNFVFMVIPFVSLFFPEKGLGLLFIHNVGFILIIWTIGIFVFQGQLKLKESLMGLINPGLVSTLVAILLVLLNVKQYVNVHVANFVLDIFQTMGGPTFPIAMIVVGAQIYKLSKEELKFNFSNITIAINRLIIIPLVLFVLAYFVRNLFPVEVIGIFMIVNVMPVSVISVSMAIRFNSDPNLAAEHVVSNHLVSILTVPVYIMFIKMLLL